jgi:hypothetical protein
VSIPSDPRIETHFGFYFLLIIISIIQEKYLSRPRRKILHNTEEVTGGRLLFLQIKLPRDRKKVEEQYCKVIVVELEI